MNRTKYVFIVAAVSLAGCAHLDYVKVPTPTQYSQWTDAQQAKADSMKGVRYYLPRPFVHLKQSVPVSQRVGLISFSYDSKANSYVLNLPPDAPSWVKRLAPQTLSLAQAVAASSVSVPASVKANASGVGGGTQSGNVGGTTNNASPATNAPSGSASATETPAQTLSANIGYVNSTDPVTKLSPIMDVVYLPDFEEQYVIQPHMGFAGQAQIDAKLRNGWAAETFEQKTDSSQLIPYVIRQVQSASDAAAKIATTWFPAGGGVPLGALASLSKSISGGVQAGTVGSEDIKTFLGQALLLKIAEVRVAQPGLYPILKPREIKQWLKAATLTGEVPTDSDDSFELFLQRSDVPWIRPDMAFVPCPPFTVVGFNTTIDVFLAPATDRIDLGSPADTNKTTPDTPPAKQDSNAQFISAISDALKAAIASSTNAEIKAVSGQNIVTSASGSTTTVNITAATSAPFKVANLQAYSSWVETALKLSKNTPANLPPQSAETVMKLEFTIKEPASQIADGLK